MKKVFIALTALSAIANVAQAQSSVSIYGIVDTGVSYTSKALIPGTTTGATGSKMSVDSGLNSGSRLGFKGTEDLGGGLSALFQLEMGFKMDTGALDGSNNGAANTSTLFRRLSVVGLSSSYGTILLGRQTDLAYQSGQFTSVADFGGITGAVGHNLDRFEGLRTNNSIRFNSATYSGFSASAIYGFGEVAGQNDAGQAVGLGAQYANGPLTVFTGFYQSRLGAAATDISSDTSTLVAGNGKAGDIAVKVVNLGASYLLKDTRIYANWSQIKQPLATIAAVPGTGILPSGYIIGGANNDKTNVYEIGANYSFTAPLHIIASAQHSVLNFAGSGHPQGKLTQLNLGVDYFLSKRTDLYAIASNLRASSTYNPGVDGTAAGQNNNQTVLSVAVRTRF